MQLVFFVRSISDETQLLKARRKKVGLNGHDNLQDLHCTVK
jgi:hypothetical protein